MATGEGWGGGRRARPTGEALRNPDPVPAHLVGTVRDPNARPAPAPAARPVMAQPVGPVRDYALRLALIQAGVITTADLAVAEASIGQAVAEALKTDAPAGETEAPS